MSAEGKKKDKGFIALLVLIIVCACLMIAAVTTLGIGMSNGDMGGSEGPKGEQGEQGVPGSKWTTGEGAPASGVGVEGDFYLDKTTGDVYEKQATGWALVMNIKGADSTVVPRISDGSNGETAGNWYVGSKDTGVKAAGTDALQPNISPDGYWCIGDEKTEYRAWDTYEVKDGKWYVNGKVVGDATVVPHIGDSSKTPGEVDGVWYIGDQNTGIKAEAVDGITPSINEDGYWVVGGTVTEYKATGTTVAICDGSHEDLSAPEYHWVVDGIDTRIPVQGTAGKDGLTPYIGQNGNWWIGDKDQGIPAKGQDGKNGETPVIGENGNWFIGTTDTGVKATGENGKNGNMWFSGEGTPVAEETETDGEFYVKEAILGDFYLDTESGKVYRLFAEGWEELASLRFELVGNEWTINGQGTGLFVAQWYNGKGNPDGKITGFKGDYYLDIETGIIYINVGEEPDEAHKSVAWEVLLTIRGSRWFYGQGVPQNDPAAFGGNLVPHDMYLDITRENGYQVYEWNGTAWVAIDGLVLKGDQGERGTRLFAGYGDPNKLDPTSDLYKQLQDEADLGDYYFETGDGVIYTLEEREGTKGWYPINSEDPLAGTKWISGAYDPDKVTNENDPEAYARLQEAKDYDVYFNLTDKTLWQLTPSTVSGVASAWVRLGVLSDQRGTKWFYGTIEPDTEDPAFNSLVEGAVLGDFYLQTYYGFDDYTGFKMYALQTEGWTLILDMSEKFSGTSYNIPNNDALRAFRNALKGGKDFEGATVNVTGNVTIPESEEFEPIGDDDHVFNGTLNGNGLSIKNITGSLFKKLGRQAQIISLNIESKIAYTELDKFIAGTDTTYGLAEASEAQTISNVKIEYTLLTDLDDANSSVGTVTVTWAQVESLPGIGEVTVKVAGNTPIMPAAASANATYPLTLSGAYTLGGASYEFENIKLTNKAIEGGTQAGYFNLDAAKAFSLKNSYIETTNTADTHNAPIFGSYEAGTTALTSLVLEGNTFASGRAVYMYNNVNGEVSIKNNVFGSDTAPMADEWAVKFMKIDADAFFSIVGNTVYGATTKDGDNASFYAFDFYSDEDHSANTFSVDFRNNAVNVSDNAESEDFGILKIESQGASGASGKYFFCGTENTLNDSNTLFEAFTYGSYTLADGGAFTEGDQNAFSFVAFNAEALHGTNMIRGQVYLGSNFGKDHNYKAENLENDVADIGGADDLVWIIDLAFADPLAFVQHVADYDTHYYVNNANGLGYFRDMVNGTFKLSGAEEAQPAESFDGKTVVTTQDIELAGINWTPIGTWNAGTAFSGTFTTTYQENRYAIKNLTIDRTIVDDGKKDLASYGPDVDMTYWTLGLFGYVTYGASRSAKLEGIHLQNVTIKANPSATNSFGMGMSYYPAIGALVGHTYQLGGAIKDILVDGDINIQSENYIRVGGVVGMTYSHLENVTLNANAGGKIASNGRGIPGTFIGGIVGHTGGTTVLTGLHASNLTISGYRNLGGLAGVMTGNGSTTVSDSTVTNIHIIQQAFTGDTYDNGTTNLYAKNVGAVAGSLGLSTTSITVKGITATDVILERPANSATKYNEKYYTKAVFHDGYVGGAYGAYKDPYGSGTVNFEGKNMLRAKLDEGLYINNGVYEIENATGLQRFADMVSKTQSFYTAKFDSRPDTEGMQVKLLNDINIADLKDAEGNWLKSQDDNEYKYEYALIPIGADTTPLDAYGANTFKGTFDGGIYDAEGNLTGSHTITGLTSALFGYTDGATIENLNLKQVNVEGVSQVGGLINVANGGETKIIDVAVNGTITATHKGETDAQKNARSIGALVGAVASGATVTVAGVSFNGTIDNRYMTEDNEYDDLALLVYNCGLVGSVLKGDATDSWASGKNVFPAANVSVDYTLSHAEKPFTFEVNANILASGLMLTVGGSTSTLTNGEQASLVATVYTANGLVNVAKLVNGGVSFANQTVALGADIEMANVAWSGIGAEGKPFAGTFRGTGEKKNFMIAHLTGSLFGNLEGKVENLTLAEPNVATTAVVAATATNATIEGVAIEGGWVQSLNGATSVKPGDFAAAPFGFYSGTATVKSSKINVVFGVNDGVVFTAVIDEEGNADVDFVGLSALDVKTNEVNVINDEIFTLEGFEGKKATFSFSNLRFTGKSMLYLNNAFYTLRLENSYVDVQPAESNGDWQYNIGFINAKSQGTNVYRYFTVEVENNLVFGGGTNGFISSWMALGGKSYFTGNTFGSAEKPYNNTQEAVIKMIETVNAEDVSLTLTISKNTFYVSGEKKGGKDKFFAIDLHQNSGRAAAYSAYIMGNTMIDVTPEDAAETVPVYFLEVEEAYVDMGGNAQVYVTNDNKVFNGVEDTQGHIVGSADIYRRTYSGSTNPTKAYDFVGYNVVLDTDMNVLSGDFFLGDDDCIMPDGTYQSGDRDKFLMNVMLLFTHVAAGATENVHIVLADDFGRTLADLLDEDEDNNVTAIDDNIYYIYSVPTGLNSFAALVNGGFNFSEKTVKPATSAASAPDNYTLDLSVYTADAPWTPIGTSDHPFNGTFDGSYTLDKVSEGGVPYTVAGLNWIIKGLKYSGTSDLAGLFGYTNGATLSNFELNGFEFKLDENATSRDTGALVAHAKDTTITGINVAASTFNGYLGNVGAVAGSIEASSVSDVTVNSVTIATNDTPNVGAVVGVAKDGCTLSEIYVGGSMQNGNFVKAEGDQGVSVAGSAAVGGVVGLADGNITVGTAEAPVWSAANVKASAVTEANYLQIGGIIGALTATSADTACTIKNAHFNGSFKRVGWSSSSSTSYANYGLVGDYTTTQTGTLTIKDSTLNVVHDENGQFVQDTKWNADGEVTSEYQIMGIEGLKFFRDQVNGGNSYAESFPDHKTIKRETVHLMADIDLENQSWTPIGNDSDVAINGAPKAVFSGIFTAYKEAEEGTEGTPIEVDGKDSGYTLNPNAYTISNLLILGHNEHTEAEACVGGNSMGLFGRTSRAVIMDLNINGAKVVGHDGVGVVIGTGKATAFKNVTVANAFVKGHSYVGGLVGHNDCSEGVWDIGTEGYENNLVVGLEATAIPEKFMKDGGPIFNHGEKIGGLVGFSKGSEFVGNTVAEAKLTAYAEIGGLVGYNDGTAMEFTSNTVKNAVLTGKRDGYTETDPDGLAGYKVEYTHKDAKADQFIEWMVGNMFDAQAAEKGVNVEGGYFKNERDHVSTIYGVDKNAKGLVYDHDQWHILSLEGLQTFRTLINDRAPGSAKVTHNNHTVPEGFEGETVVLEDNIDLNPQVVASKTRRAPAGGVNWEPIGSQSNPFRGTFDGQGFTISNLNIESADHGYLGLFGNVRDDIYKSATCLQNFTLENVNINVENVDYVGAVAGYFGPTGGDAGRSLLSNVTVQGEVSIQTKGDFVGGIAGYINNSTLNKVTINAADNSIVKSEGKNDNGAQVGGIAGHVAQTLATEINTNLNVTGQWAGGLYACLDSYASTLTDVHVTANVTASTKYVGGLVGGIQYATGGYKLTISDSTFTGDLSTSDETVEDLASSGFIGAAINADESKNESSITESLANVTNMESELLQGKEGIFYGEIADFEGNIVKGYLIESAAGLKAFAEIVNGGHSFKDEIVALIKNIDLAGSETNPWTPIGNPTNRFLGMFDGMDHTISNVYLTGDKYVGLFGLVGWNDEEEVPDHQANPLLKNIVFGGKNEITITGAPSDKRTDAGLLVGYLAHATVENIRFSGTLTIDATEYQCGAIGGLVGASQSNTYSGISVKGVTITASNGICVGGVVGYSMNDRAYTDITVESVQLTAKYELGGVIGLVFTADATLTLSDITVKSAVLTLTTAENTSLVGGFVGGLVGNLEVSGNESEFTIYRGQSSEMLLNRGLIGGLGKIVGDSLEANLTVTSATVELTVGADENNLDFEMNYTWNSNSFETSKFKIYSAYGLTYFAELVNNGYSFAGETVTLAKNIDLGGVNWTPIGTSEKPFSGEFDGKEYTISGLKIESTTARNTTGLFGNLNGATVQSLTIDNVNINAPKAEYVGALASGITDSTVTNVTIHDATIVGGTWVGGVVGHMSGNSHVENCAVTVGTLSVQNYKLGGVVGFVAGEHTEAKVSGNTVGSVKLLALVQSEENADDGFGMVGGVVGGTDHKSDVTVSGNRLIDVTIDVSAIGIQGKTPKDGDLVETDFRIYERYTGALVPNSGLATYSGNTGSVTVIAPDALMMNKGLSGPCGTAEDEIPTFLDNDIEVIWNGLKAKDDGYYVSNEAGMKTFRDMVNGGHDFNGETVYLEKDVTLSGEWTPIGGSEFHDVQTNNGTTKVCDNPFKGTFDGQGYTVRGLLIGDGSLQHSVFKVGTLDYAGLFGYTDGNAVIKNVKLSNPVVSGKDSVGALVGHANDHTTIEGVEVIDPIVSGSTSIGGVVGGYFSSVWVKDVKVSGHIVIVGNYKVGGVVGGGYGNIQNATVEAGDLLSHIDGVAAVDENGIVSQLEGDNVGGIIGYTGEGDTYTYDGLTVKNISVMGSRKVGGAVGYYNRANNVTNPNSGFHITNVTVENVDVFGFCTDDYAKDNMANLFVGAVVGEFCSSVCGGMEHVSVKDVTVEALYTYPSGAQSGTKPSEVVGGTRAANGVLTLSDVTLENVTVNSNVQIDRIEGGRIREVSVSTPAQLVFVDNNHGDGELFPGAGEGLSFTINLLNDIDMDNVDPMTDAQGHEYNWVALNGHWVTLNGNGHTIKNMKVVADYEGKAGLFGYAGANNVNGLTIENFTAYGAQVGTFSGHSFDTQTITNSYLKGTVNLVWSVKNPVKDGADFTEKYCGVGAITGINGAGSSYGVTIDKDCVVTITFDSEFSSTFTNNGEYLVGYSAGEPNVGGAVNNGTLYVYEYGMSSADSTSNDPQFVLTYSEDFNGEYVIYNYEGLVYFRSLVNEKGTDFTGKTVALATDISLQNSEIGGGQSNWTPIGTGANPFYGTFDGNGHVISDLVNTSGESELGLFGYASQFEGQNNGTDKTATLKNLIIENVELKGDQHVAGLVGTLVYGSIENVTVRGSIKIEATTHAAGVVGLCYGTLKDVFVDGTPIENEPMALDATPNWNIHATQKVAGGIVGGFAGNSLSHLEAEHISVFVDGVNATQPDSTDVGYAGGIAGVVVDTANVTASDLRVDGVQVGAGTETANEAATQNAGALLGSVIGAMFTFEEGKSSYYVSSDTAIVNEAGEVVETEGDKTPEQGNNAPVVGGTFELPEEDVIWLDVQAEGGLVVVYKGPKGNKEGSTIQYVEVYTTEGLTEAANLVKYTTDYTSFPNKNIGIHIMNDIKNVQWSAYSIGNSSAPYGGVFEGNNHSIEIAYKAGLFGYLAPGAVVRNIKIESNPQKPSFGFFIQSPMLGTMVYVSREKPVIFENITVTGTVYNAPGVFVGEVISHDYETATVKEAEFKLTNCTNEAQLIVNNEASQPNRLVGLVAGNYGASIDFINCKSTGNMQLETTTSGNGCHAAGILGYSMRCDGSRADDGKDHGDVKFQVRFLHCANTGSITIKRTGGSGAFNVGGIISTEQGGSSYYFEDCVNTGALTANDGLGGPNVGGIIGRQNGSYPTQLINCSNTGNLEGISTVGGVNVGGLVGFKDGGAELVVRGATVSGVMTATEAITTGYAGAFIGDGSTGTTVNDSSACVMLNAKNAAHPENYFLFGGASKIPDTVKVTNTTLTLVLEKDEDGTAGYTHSMHWDGDGNYVDEGYHIYTLGGLEAFRDSVNEGNTYAGATILLEAGFDLGGEDAPWAPIGFSNPEESAPFAEIFDGQGYKLTNLYVTNLAPQNQYNQQLGLFGSVRSATIRNLTIENAYVFHNNDTHCVAVLVGESFPGAHISNITVKGTVVVKGFQYTGGIIGKGYVNVDNCRVEASEGSYVENNWQYAGGIAGWLGEDGSSISGCYTNINIRVTKAGYSAIGAVSGIAQANNLIENCTIDGVTLTVERVFSKDDEDSNGVGAIAGRGENNVTLRGNSGEVTVITDKSVRLNYHGFIGNAKNNVPLTGLTLENNDLKINWNGLVMNGDQWTINDLKGLTTFAEIVNEGNNCLDVTVTLTDDIDLDNKEWTPIASKDSQVTFAGTFDGNNYTISHLNVPHGQDGGDAIRTNEQAGLFGSANGSTIKNLTIDGATVTAGRYAGALAGVSNNATLENIHIKNATVNGAHFVAALTGYAHSGLILRNCSVEGCTVNGVAYVDEAPNNNYNTGDKIGGFVGQVSGDTLIITGCTISDTTIRAWRDVGAIAGMLNNDGTITGNTITGVTIYVDHSNAEKNQAPNATLRYGEVFGRYETGVASEQEEAMKAVNDVKDVTIEFVGIDAKINETYYTTLQEAFRAVKEGETVELLNDLTVTSDDLQTYTWYQSTTKYTYTTFIDLYFRNHDDAQGNNYNGAVPANFTFDGKGHTITSKLAMNAGYLFYFGPQNGVTFKNFTIEGDARCAFYIQDDTKNFTFDSVNVRGNYYILLWLNSNPEVTLKNCNIENTADNTQNRTLWNGDGIVHLVHTTIDSIAANFYVTLEDKDEEGNWTNAAGTLKGLDGEVGPNEHAWGRVYVDKDSVLTDGAFQPWLYGAAIFEDETMPQSWGWTSIALTAELLASEKLPGLKYQTEKQQPETLWFANTADADMLIQFLAQNA